MANQRNKNHYYVLVLTDNGPIFVTKINYSTKTAMWNRTEKPLEMSKSEAECLELGLVLNFNHAFMIKTKYEITSQVYQYDKGHFEWKWNEEN